jgi:hypothetical protein
MGAFVSHSAAAPPSNPGCDDAVSPESWPGMPGAPYNGPIGTFVNVLCADQVDRAMLVS